MAIVCAVESSGAVPLETVRDTGVRERADITALASRQERSISRARLELSRR